MYHFIINPVSRSGRGQKLWNELKPYLKKKKGIRISLLEFSRMEGF